MTTITINKQAFPITVSAEKYRDVRAVACSALYVHAKAVAGCNL